ncbi:Saccharopine dehydrogenase-domain-containing protein [Podospora didyma]|uniref:Saccharopine dehydrogenase-domain-containing protein n=1 Tax=Podospora didyma TaxID=330526 RepID=A0AAE0K125_9PEZI|nr:Saccharopine dehydrogenase-domain-containing protein [Podospora didyma]
MPSNQHGRQYDVVVFGASGYTGKYTAQHIATHLPTDLKWAVAGRSRSKLDEVVAACRELNPNRLPPAIEVAELNDEDLASLAKKTCVLITTVGPYGKLGEHAFKACAENGTHYLDVTGEVPFVARMLAKYEAAAKASGAMMFPQIGIESAPSDLITWSLASLIRTELKAKTRGVVVSIHKLKSAPSGGTLATALSLLENFSLKEVRAGQAPFILSPVPPPSFAPPSPSILTRLTGLITVPSLGLLTSSIAARTDAAVVERSWGLLSTIPALQAQAYGPRFSFREYMKPRNWLTGIGIHFGLIVFGLILFTPFLRNFVAKRVYQPGQGPDAELAKRDELEYRAIAHPDVSPSEEKKKAFARCWFNGSTYHLTGILLAEAAATLLEEKDVHLLGGGLLTPACLGQSYIERLDRAGFHFENKMLSE